VKDLSLLQYTAINSLNKATIAPLKQLEGIALPVTLTGIEEGIFAGARHLRYADFLQCDSTDVVAGLRSGGFAKLGINTQQTLAYVPSYARAYKLAERDGNTLVFNEVKGELQAMQPYLLKVVGNKHFRKMSTTLDSKTAQTIPASGGMTYGRQVDALGYSISNADAAELGAYVLQSDGDWHPVVTDNTKAEILPFRAFLLPSARTAAARISMTLVDDDATGIDTIETIDEDGTHRYYDLNGRELQGKPDQGVYIYNGKKYVNK
jgi:hypothetical protein